MVKLIAWDLDNNLWTGVAYYTDKDTIRLKKGAKQVLKEINNLGLLNAACSRNNTEDAMKLLEKFGIKKYFTAFKIGWGLKSDYLKELSRELKVPLSQILFLDDDAFQRAEVEKSTGIKTAYFDNLLELLDHLNIDKGRIKVLKEHEGRLTAEHEFKGDFKGFLNSCNIEMRVREAVEDDLPRVVQLLNKTNELNATGNHKSLREIKEDNDCILVAELTDKFGNYGIIAEAIIKKEDDAEWFIKDFTVSCRTMGRGVGKAMLIYIMNLAKLEKARNIRGYLKHSADNWRMQPLYEKRGFEHVGKFHNKDFYEFRFNKPIPDYPEWIKIKTQ